MNAKQMLDLTWTTGAARRERTMVFASFTVALLILLGMYFSNANWGGGGSDTERGDGTYRPILARGDGHLMYLMTQSLVADKDLRYENNLRAFGDPWKQAKTKTGRRAIPHPIGPTLVQAIPFILAQQSARALNFLGADIPLHGYSMWHQRIVYLISVLGGFCAVVLGFFVARKVGMGLPAATLSAVAVLFGTSLTYYSTYAPAYAHALDAFFSSLFLSVWALGVGRWSLKRMAFLGALLGLAGLMRVTGFGLGVVLCVECAIAIIKDLVRGEQSLKVTLIGAAKKIALGLVALAVALVVFTPQLLTWKIVYGEWITSPSGPAFMRMTQPEWVELLFSSRNGWLSTHPIAYLSVVGLLSVPKRGRTIASAFFVAVAIQVYANACVYDWWAGASFGQRRLCSVTLVLVFGLACLLHSLLRLGSNRLLTMIKALTLCLVTGLVISNLVHLQHYRNGKSPGASLRRVCCANDSPLSTFLKPMYQRVGNPFAWPANLLFALKYGISPSRFDALVGSYADFPRLDQLNSGAHRGRSFPWRLDGRSSIRGLEHSGKAKGGGISVTTLADSSFFLPLYDATEDRTLSMQIFARTDSQPVSVEVNGTKVLAEDLHDGWNTLFVTLPKDLLSRGSNAVSLHATLGEPTASMNHEFGQAIVWPAGVLVRSLRVGYAAGEASARNSRTKAR